MPRSAEFVRKANELLENLRAAAKRLHVARQDVGAILSRIKDSMYYEVWGFTSWTAWLETKPFGISMNTAKDLIDAHRLSREFPALAEISVTALAHLASERRLNPKSGTALIKEAVKNPSTFSVSTTKAKVLERRGSTRRVTRVVSLRPNQVIVWNLAIKNATKNRHLSDSDAISAALHEYNVYCGS